MNARKRYNLAVEKKVLKNRREAEKIDRRQTGEQNRRGSESFMRQEACRSEK